MKLGSSFSTADQPVISDFRPKTISIGASTSIGEGRDEIPAEAQYSLAETKCSLAFHGPEGDPINTTDFELGDILSETEEKIDSVDNLPVTKSFQRLEYLIKETAESFGWEFKPRKSKLCEITGDGRKGVPINAATQFRKYLKKRERRRSSEIAFNVEPLIPEEAVRPSIKPRRASSKRPHAIDPSPEIESFELKPKRPNHNASLPLRSRSRSDVFRTENHTPSQFLSDPRGNSIIPESGVGSIADEKDSEHEPLSSHEVNDPGLPKDVAGPTRRKAAGKASDESAKRLKYSTSVNRRKAAVEI